MDSPFLFWMAWHLWGMFRQVLEPLGIFFSALKLCLLWMKMGRTLNAYIYRVGRLGYDCLVNIWREYYELNRKGFHWIFGCYIFRNFCVDILGLFREDLLKIVYREIYEMVRLNIRLVIFFLKLCVEILGLWKCILWFKYLVGCCLLELNIL